MGLKTRGAPSGPVDSEKVTINFAAGTLASHTTTTVTTPLTGVRTTDVVSLSMVSALPAGAELSAGARVTADGVISVTFGNPTPANIAGGSPTIDCLIHRFS